MSPAEKPDRSLTTLRMPGYLHRKLKKFAAEERVSLNTFIVDTLDRATDARPVRHVLVEAGMRR